MASDGSANVSYPASNPANSPQVVNITAPDAPQTVTGLTSRIDGNDLKLSWSAVTRNVSGQSITVAYYAIHRDVNPYFTPSSAIAWIPPLKPTIITLEPWLTRARITTRSGCRKQ